MEVVQRIKQQCKKSIISWCFLMLCSMMLVSERNTFYSAGAKQLISHKHLLLSSFYCNLTTLLLTALLFLFLAEMQINNQLKIQEEENGKSFCCFPSSNWLRLSWNGEHILWTFSPPMKSALIQWFFRSGNCEWVQNDSQQNCLWHSLTLIRILEYCFLSSLWTGFMTS